MNKPKELNMERMAISVPEAAKLLGVSKCKAYELAKMQGFPAVQIDKRILVSVKGLERWLDAQTTASAGVSL